jgi:hypothetical protein
VNARASAASRPTIILAAIAALALSLMYLVRPAYAGEPATLNPAHVGTDSSQTADGADCKDGDAPAGMVLWHFILNDVTPGIDDPIPGHFDFHDSGTQDVDSSQWNPGGGTHHFYVFTTGDDVLDGATADIGDSTYNNFNLSHICHGDEVDQSVEESVEESVAESVEESVGESVAESVEESVGESVAESVEESVGESVGESVNESVAESGEQSLEAGEGTPEESQSDTSMGLGGSNPLPTIAFGLILLASLTGLAFVNVKAARSR